MRNYIIYCILFFSFHVNGQSDQTTTSTIDSVTYSNKNNKLQYLHRSICKDSLPLSKSEITKIIESYRFPETKEKLQSINLLIKKESRKKYTNLITSCMLFLTAGSVYSIQKSLGQQSLGIVTGSIFGGAGLIFIGVYHSHKAKARNHKKQLVELYNKYVYEF